MSIALRNLRTGRGRLVASLSGVAFSVLLILFLLGVFNGFIAAASDYVENTGADVWVAEEGSDNLFRSTGALRDSLEGRVRGTQGVTAVGSIIAIPAIGHKFDEDGPQVDLLVVGHDARSGLGGPGPIDEGRDATRKDEVVVTRSFLLTQDLAIGDVISVFETDLTIVGAVDRASVAFFAYAYVTLETARDLLGLEGRSSFILVKVREGADAQAVADAIERRIRDDGEAFTTAVFSDNTSANVRDVFVPILLAIAAIGFASGIAVVSITTWSAVNERLPEYGVLKAMGAGNGMLYRIVIAYATVAALAGFAVGLLLYLLATELLTDAIPQLTLLTSWPQVVLMFFATMAMAVGASYVPVRSIARIDPADVFRGE